jgi:transcription initiation factor TFIIE subunit alpha
VAGSTGERQQEDGIGIVLTTDKDEETVRNERLKEAETKKAQNIMPLWHLRSTITNDLTALGIKEKAQNAAAAQQVAGPSNLNLDESLKGLGKVGRAKDQVTTPEDAVDEDVKPGVTAEGNEVDCKFVPPSFLYATRKKLTPLFFSLLPPIHSRLRSVLCVSSSFDGSIDTTHTIGRVLRIRRFRRRPEIEYRVSRSSK